MYVQTLYGGLVLHLVLALIRPQASPRSCRVRRAITQLLLLSFFVTALPPKNVILPKCKNSKMSEMSFLLMAC